MNETTSTMSNQRKTETETFISPDHREAFVRASHQTDTIPNVYKTEGKNASIEHIPNEVESISADDALRVVEAIQTAYKTDCFHLDIHINNLRRRENGDIVVIDWGHSYYYPESRVFFTHSGIPGFIDLADPQRHELRWSVIYLFGKFLEQNGFDTIGNRLQSKMSFRTAKKLLNESVNEVE